MEEKEREITEEVTKKLSVLSVTDWIIVKFPGKENVQYYVRKALEIKEEKVLIKFFTKNTFLQVQIVAILKESNKRSNFAKI